jgi:threonyl-tRNA synthetase
MPEASEIRVAFPAGEAAAFPPGTTGAAIAARKGLGDSVVAVRQGERLLDLSVPLTAGEAALVERNTPAGVEVLRHSASHIMAEAVLSLFPGTKVAIGPAIEDGFYYDFDLPRPLTEEDLPRIEEKMREIARAAAPFARREVGVEEARRVFPDQPYKQELLDEIGKTSPTVSLYSQGGFTDLCRGPHVPHTGWLKDGTFKLLSVAGAYWRGDEHNAMLQRVYGTAFDSSGALEAYLKRREEIARRDHRRLGKELDIYSINPEYGPGLVLWHPAGAMVRRVIETFWTEEHLRRGYFLAYTPHLASEDIYRRSGHLEAYSEMMYAPLQIEGRPYRAKPMNCPGHVMIYQSRQRSYRDLPMRYAELGTVYRFERSGVLHGLLRVRGFTQDDAHIFCRPDQLKAEVHGVLDLADFLLRTFGYTYKTYLATRPAKFIGTDEEWTFATKCLRDALEERKQAYEVDEGGGVFYAPKIDLKLLDALGREWQGPTCQVDLNLPHRFGVEFVGEDGKPVQAIMVHRTVLGSMERFIGGLLEHYGGAFPVWLAPVQVRILPVSGAFVEAARRASAALQARGIRVEVDDRNEKVGHKVRDGELLKIPYLLVVGKREVEKGTVSVRRRGTGDEGPMDVGAFVERVAKENAEKVLG